MHPSDITLKIFIFADVPHLLKLARNNLFDSGFIIDNKTATKDILDELVALNSGDMKIAFNLTRRHLDVKGSQRQSVKLAAQMFSNRNAKAIEYCGKKGFFKKDNWQIMARVLQLFNDWFDILNCKSKFGKHSDSKAYGMELKKQDAVIDEMNELLSKMYIPIKKNESKTPCLRNALLPFQKGILLTNKSLKELFQYVKEKYSTDSFKIEYLITRRLNQDVIENLFSYIRHMGGTNDHPSPVEWQYRLKSYILGKHAEETLSRNQNTENDTSSVNFMSIEEISSNSSNLGNTKVTPEEDDYFAKEEELFLPTQPIFLANRSKSNDSLLNDQMDVVPDDNTITGILIILILRCISGGTERLEYVSIKDPE